MFGAFRIVMGSTQYYTIRLNPEGDAQREQKKVNPKNLRKAEIVEKCSIDKT